MDIIFNGTNFNREVLTSFKTRKAFNEGLSSFWVGHEDREALLDKLYDLVNPPKPKKEKDTDK
jgi:hypothetical protein